MQVSKLVVFKLQNMRAAVCAPICAKSNFRFVCVICSVLFYWRISAPALTRIWRYPLPAIDIKQLLQFSFIFLSVYGYVVPGLLKLRLFIYACVASRFQGIVSHMASPWGLSTPRVPEKERNPIKSKSITKYKLHT